MYDTPYNVYNVVYSHTTSPFIYRFEMFDEIDQGHVQVQDQPQARAPLLVLNVETMLATILHDPNSSARFDELATHMEARFDELH